MKAITLEAPREFRHIEIPTPPAPGPGEALVQSRRMGICGTDYSCYLGKFPFFDYPRIPGHELGVEVLEVGEEVDGIAAGDRCSVEPYLNCGDCFACRKGNSNCCQSLKVIGVMQDGGLCERFVIRADKLHRSKSLSCEQLALVETLAIGCHATDRGAPGAGDQVLIIGAGPIGLATLEFTRLTGASITVMDMVQSRLDFCQAKYNVDHTVRFQGDGTERTQLESISDGNHFAVVFDASGSHQSMSSALTYVAHTGTLVFVGVTTSEVAFKHPLMHRRELTLKASRNALPQDFQRIIALIEAGDVDTDPWITHRTSFDDVIGDFESFTRPESGVIKAVIEVT